MAVIGGQLSVPDAGWRRLDNSDYGIFYKGSWTSLNYNFANAYSGAYAYTNSTSASVHFKFYGTKLRIIARAGDSTYTTQAELVVDGNVISTFSMQGVGTTMVLMAEATNLTEGFHQVIIRVKQGAGGGLNLDAIDIDREGYLRPGVKKDLKNLKIGDKVSCYFTSRGLNDGSGTISNFGEEYDVPSSVLIPPIGNTYNRSGYFYFVYVGNDHLGRMLLIADRNLKHTISFNRLNTDLYGSHTGKTYEYNYEGYSIRFRLLTGAINQEDADLGNSEWDKYIKSSSLDGAITPGDNNLWNWNGIYTLTSTVGANQSNSRVIRGYTSTNTVYRSSESTGQWPVDSANDIVGFRPVAVVERVLNPGKYLIKDGNEIKTFNTISKKWELVGNAPPTKAMFDRSGLEVLGPIFVQNPGFSVPMQSAGALPEGTVYKAPINHLTYKNIRKIEVK